MAFLRHVSFYIIISSDNNIVIIIFFVTATPVTLAVCTKIFNNSVQILTVYDRWTASKLLQSRHSLFLSVCQNIMKKREAWKAEGRFL